MRCGIGLVVVLWVAVACSTEQSTSASQSNASEPPVSAPHREAPPDLTSAAMLALGKDRLLFWTNAWVWIRSSDGVFGPRLRLPYNTHQLVVFGERILAAGFQHKKAGPNEALVVLMDAAGKELGRWPLAQSVVGLLLDARGARALTTLGLITLEDVASSPEPFAPGIPLPLGYAARPYVFDYDSAHVVCLSNNTLTKNYKIMSHCERTGAQGYRFKAQLREPVACGPWLAFAAGDELVVHALDTGKRIASRSLTKIGELICEGEAHLLVAAESLERRSLPSLVREVSVELPKGETLQDLAVLEHGIAYRVHERPYLVSIMLRAR
jgi:hypothetical protein